ncbi:unnamed protein product [Brassica rapa subsp. trilocularis]
MSFETLSPPLRSSFLVLSEALSLPEPPDPPDASCRSLFFCTLTHHSLCVCNFSSYTVCFYSRRLWDRSSISYVLF